MYHFVLHIPKNTSWLHFKPHDYPSDWNKPHDTLFDQYMGGIKQTCGINQLCYQYRTREYFFVDIRCRTSYFLLEFYFCMMTYPGIPQVLAPRLKLSRPWEVWLVCYLPSGLWSGGRRCSRSHQRNHCPTSKPRRTLGWTVAKHKIRIAFYCTPKRNEVSNAPWGGILFVVTHHMMDDDIK